MTRSTTIVLALLLLLGICGWLLIRDDRTEGLGDAPLLVHCAAGLRIQAPH